MLPSLLVLGALLLLVLLYAGARLLLAGRQLDHAPTALAPTAGSVAGKVDARLQRTRAAVETLVMPEVEPSELQPSAGAFRDRAQTYVVLGTGLLGLAGCLVIGVLLLL